MAVLLTTRIYAESVVHRIEQMQMSTSREKDISGTAPVPSETSDSNPAVLTALTAGEPRSNTAILSEEEGNPEINLSALEFALVVIIPSEFELPELRDRTNPGQTDVSDAPSRTDDDNVSSVCEAPALPGGGPRYIS